MTQENEDKYFQEIGSLRDKIDNHIVDSQDFRNEFRKSQEKIGEALVGLARSSEQLIALNKDTAKNEESIQQLYDLNRETEKQITSHVLQSTHSAAGHPDPVLESKAKKFDKIQLGLILGVGYWVVDLIYNA